MDSEGPVTEEESFQDREKQKQTEGRRGTERLIPALAVQLGRGLGGIGEARRGPAIGSMLAVCVSRLTTTVTENAWCAEAHAGSHEVYNRTKQMHLFSQFEEFANVHIRG